MTKSTPEERALNALETAQRRSIKANERASTLHEQWQIAVAVAEDADVRLEYAASHPDLPSEPETGEDPGAVVSEQATSSENA